MRLSMCFWPRFTVMAENLIPIDSQLQSDKQKSIYMKTDKQNAENHACLQKLKKID